MNKIDKNQIYENYCSKNGVIIDKIQNNNFTLQSIENSICYNCKTENNYKSNYCKFCGENLSELKQSSEKNKKEYKDIKCIFKSINKMKIAITSFSAIFILLLISFVLNIGARFIFQGFSSEINPTYILMGLNLGYIDINSYTALSLGHVNVHIGILLLIIMPVLSLIFSNMIFMKKENKDAKSTILNSIGVGFTYAIILTAICIFNKIKINNYDMMQYGMSFSAQFKPLSIFINGFIIAFLTTYIFGYKKSYKDENIYLYILKKAINTIIIGYIAVLLILSVIIIRDNSYLYEFGMYGYINDLSIGVILTQLAAYIWGFANFIPVTISKYTISIFNLLGSDLFLDTKLIFIAMILLSFLILLVIGCNLKSKYKDNNINVVLIFSLFYAFLMGALAYLSYIVIGGSMSSIDISNYQSSIILGSSVISTIIRSFIYSFIAVGLGYKLYTFEEDEMEENYE